MGLAEPATTLPVNEPLRAAAMITGRSGSAWSPKSTSKSTAMGSAFQT